MNSINTQEICLETGRNPMRNIRRKSSRDRMQSVQDALRPVNVLLSNDATIVWYSTWVLQVFQQNVTEKPKQNDMQIAAAAVCWHQSKQICEFNELETNTESLRLLKSICYAHKMNTILSHWNGSKSDQWPLQMKWNLFYGFIVAAMRT